MCWFCMTSNFPDMESSRSQRWIRTGIRMCLLTLNGLLSSSYWVKEQVGIVKVMTELCLEFTISSVAFNLKTHIT